MDAPVFSRSNPSPRYRELIGLYRDMHENGERQTGLPAEQTFDGRSLPRQAARIKQLIDHHQARSLLDYGCGKGKQYQIKDVSLSDGRRFGSIKEFWGVDSITCYDPGYVPFSTLPEGRFDAVISTDVLEHCPEQDIDWIVGELFGYASRFVFANVACYPAKKHLANGENAHCTIRPPEWWRGMLREQSARRPGVAYYFILESFEEIGGKRTLREDVVSG